MTVQQQAAEIDRKVTAGILTRRQAIEMKEKLLRQLPKRSAAPKVRTPAQVLQQLRRDFGDERRVSGLWDRLPEPLQRHWAYHKQRAGETLTPVERRAIDTEPRFERRVHAGAFVVVR